MKKSIVRSVDSGCLDADGRENSIVPDAHENRATRQAESRVDQGAGSA